MHFPVATILPLLRAALDEDIGKGDITSITIIPASAQQTLHLTTRESCVVCGLAVAEATFRMLDPGLYWTPYTSDGQHVTANTRLATVRGNSRALLAAERVAINFLQLLSGIATETQRYVAAIRHTPARLLDTRKTLPCLRQLSKYAVRTGGGHNHRQRLDDGLMIKDNHIAAAGSLTAAINSTRAVSLPLVVECDTLAQMAEALAAGARWLLLDNMTISQLRQAVIIRGQQPVVLEASGGVSLATISRIAETGVDYISTSRITFAAPPIDIGLDG